MDSGGFICWPMFWKGRKRLRGETWHPISKPNRFPNILLFPLYDNRDIRIEGQVFTIQPSNHNTLTVYFTQFLVFTFPPKEVPFILFLLTQILNYELMKMFVTLHIQGYYSVLLSVPFSFPFLTLFFLFPFYSISFLFISVLLSF